MHPKVRFLTAVWGRAYITRFAELALPSFLAPGNLPALAETTDLEVVIMTRSSDISYFESLHAFQHLREICPIRFVEIDDLITNGVYGVTLTLAYARPIIASGREMLNTHFVFMNADFVLADGSLRTLSRKIAEGCSIVLGPSFRSIAEDVEPQLQSALDPESGILAMQPREMAALALAHPHATTIAKIMPQSYCHSTHPNQFFWRINDHALLGRYYLIFMLCLKPERIIESINSYCDYAFIPEMCPSGQETVMANSDEFLMLELQQREQEAEMLRFGIQSELHIARSLQYWTTAEHRRAAQHDVIFRAGPTTDAEVQKARLKAQSFINKIEARLRRPQDHEDHHYWSRGTIAWHSRRKMQGAKSTPPELAPPPGIFGPLIFPDWLKGQIRRFIWTCAYYVEGMLKDNITTPSWFSTILLDHRLFTQNLSAILAEPHETVLIISDDPGQLVGLTAGRSEVLCESASNLVEKKNTITVLHPKLTHILIHLSTGLSKGNSDILKVCLPAVDAGASCNVYAAEPSGINLLVAQEMLERLRGYSIKCRFVGGTLKSLNRSQRSRIHRSLHRFDPIGWLLAPPRLAVNLVITLISNLVLCRMLPTSEPMRNCSSMLVSIKGADNES